MHAHMGDVALGCLMPATDGEACCHSFDDEPMSTGLSVGSSGSGRCSDVITANAKWFACIHTTSANGALLLSRTQVVPHCVSRHLTFEA